MRREPVARCRRTISPPESIAAEASAGARIEVAPGSEVGLSFRGRLVSRYAGNAAGVHDLLGVAASSNLVVDVGDAILGLPPHMFLVRRPGTLGKCECDSTGDSHAATDADEHVLSTC